MLDLTTKTLLRQGNPAAFKELFDALYPRLKVYCSLFISNKNQIDDIIQDSFIALWEKREKIRPEKSIESLVFVMVKNRCLNFLKKMQMEDGSFDLDKIISNELQFLYQLDFKGKEEDSLETELFKSFSSAVENLPPKMKLVFTHCKIDGRKQYEVAQELGISLKMVEKHISRAKKLIKGELLAQYPSHLILLILSLQLLG